jgi:SAM-dependent methyltransferase
MSELFELSEQYAEMLERGIRLSGESQEFFIAGRLRHLARALPAGFHPARIVDFGCGIGHTASWLAQTFPQAHITGVDTAENALAWAAARYASPRVSFCRVAELGGQESFDLCYTNGVFHHIEPADRPEALRLIRGALRPGGALALFENNPWNPGARMVMSRIPFDRDARPISPAAARRMLRAAGFARCAPARSLFYFPRALAWLRPAESRLARLPLGAQYCVLGYKE